MSSPSVGLLDVRAFTLTPSVLDFTEGFLRDIGRQGYEGLVVWGGRRRLNEPLVDIDVAVAPKQRCFRTPEGVGLSVDEDELFRLNVDFYGRRLLLVGQVHSHPSEAYHSPTDDDYAVVTIPGGLSIVVPDFGRGPLFEDAATYRLNGEGSWMSIPSRGVVGSLIQFL
jgi:hypothetical protein